MLSAWCSDHGGLVLGQTKTDTKSNEITAIPELLHLLAIKGCTAHHARCLLRQPCVRAVRSPSIHAMGDIARLIRSPSMAGWKRWGMYPDWGILGKFPLL